MLAGWLARNRALDFRNLAPRSGLSDFPRRGCCAQELISVEDSGHYSATCVKTPIVCSTLLEISNRDARSMFTKRVAARRDGSDQNRIASRKPIKSPA